MEISRHSLSGTFEFRLAVLLAAGYFAAAIQQQLLGKTAIDRKPA